MSDPSSSPTAAEPATSELMALVYDELRGLADAWFRRQPSDHTLQSTALVHEAYLRLARAPAGHWRDRAHFLAVASVAMRRVLVDHARARASLKRGAFARAHRISLDAREIDSSIADAHAPVDLVALDAALTRLERLDARQSRIVELRYLGGLTLEETARELGISERTVRLDWSMARAWLLGELRRDEAS